MGWRTHLRKTSVNDTLVGKRALVTGASFGIGLATASLFAEHGATVVGLAKRWSEIPDNIDCVTGDVTSGLDVTEAVERAAGERGLDILVANAGIAPQEEGWHTGSPETWLEVVKVNLLGVMRCFHAAGANMIRHARKGRLLATASVAGLRPFADAPSYGASKAGVISVVQSAALAFGGHGIKVNAIAPGHIADTVLHQAFVQQEAQARGRRVEDLLSALGAAVPLGRLGTSRDLAAAALFLASDAAAYISGASCASTAACSECGLAMCEPHDAAGPFPRQLTNHAWRMSCGPCPDHALPK
jgi:NAD(P)-dependent dehydrogenase (short-subunit alcohol dehydrogenase family)